MKQQKNERFKCLYSRIHFIRLWLWVRIQYLTKRQYSRKKIVHSTEQTHVLCNTWLDMRTAPRTKWNTARQGKSKAARIKDKTKNCLLWCLMWPIQWQMDAHMDDITWFSFCCRFFNIKIPLNRDKIHRYNFQIHCIASHIHIHTPNWYKWAKRWFTPVAHLLLYLGLGSMCVAYNTISVF